MLFQIFAVYDEKAKMFTQPFFAPAVGSAVRSFEEGVNKAGHEFNKWPEDFTLFHIGTYDDTNAIITPMSDGKRPLGNGLEFVKSK